MTVYCTQCRKCLCKRCHPRGACPDRSRRFFFLGALAAPLVAQLPRVSLASDNEILAVAVNYRSGVSWRAVARSVRAAEGMIRISYERASRAGGKWVDAGFITTVSGVDDDLDWIRKTIEEG